MVTAYGIFISVLLIVHFTKAKILRIHMSVIPSLLALGILMHWWSVANPVRTIVGVGAFALAINILPNAPNRIQQLLSFMPLRVMGVGSFSVYLWQQPFYLAVHAGSIPMYVGVVMAIACGTASFYFLERLLRRYLNLNWGRADRSRASEVAT